VELICLGGGEFGNALGWGVERSNCGGFYVPTTLKGTTMSGLSESTSMGFSET
jgi:hypothetical protein